MSIQQKMFAQWFSMAMAGMVLESWGMIALSHYFYVAAIVWGVRWAVKS